MPLRVAERRHPRAVHLCVCVCEREREREREGVCVCGSAPSPPRRAPARADSRSFRSFRFLELPT